MGGIYWLASYPKSGNTWFRTFLANLLSGLDTPVDINDLSHTIASSRGWLDEVLGFDTAELHPDEVDRLRPHVYRWSLRAPTPSYHKIHDAYHMVGGEPGAGAGAPPGAPPEPLTSREATLGALYIIRNPLDVAPSYANHRGSSIDSAIAAMADPAHAFATGTKGLPVQVRQRMGTWSQHVLSWVDAPGLDCTVIRYEDMQRTPLATFTRAVQFLRAPDDPARIEKALEFSRFDTLAQMERERGFREKSPRTGSFFRKGTTGDWRDTLSPPQVRAVIDAHGPVMRRFGYLDDRGEPVDAGARGEGVAVGGGGAVVTGAARSPRGAAPDECAS
jgi:hypothetical protein